MTKFQAGIPYSLVKLWVHATGKAIRFLYADPVTIIVLLPSKHIASKPLKATNDALNYLLCCFMFCLQCFVTKRLLTKPSVCFSFLTWVVNKAHIVVF